MNSYPILSKKLSALGVDFNVNTLKSVFPYKFSLQDNFFYVGPTPNIDYCENITKEEYSKVFKVNWSFKEESLLYLNDENHNYKENKENKELKKKKKDKSSNHLFPINK
jgi:hypothetical protein